MSTEHFGHRANCNVIHPTETGEPCPPRCDATLHGVTRNCARCGSVFTDITGHTENTSAWVTFPAPSGDPEYAIKVRRDSRARLIVRSSSGLVIIPAHGNEIIVEVKP